MDTLAARWAAQGVGSIFVYTHEVHPGEYYPHLTSWAQKLRHAHDLRTVLGVARPILVDALDGACHRAYGSMPNMSWIFTATGVPVYKANWTDADSLASAVAYLLETGTRRQAGARLGPFHVERLDYRNQDRAAFDARLARNGPKAVREFHAAFG